jgi:hypothetical protein
MMMLGRVGVLPDRLTTGHGNAERTADVRMNGTIEVGALTELWRRRWPDSRPVADELRDTEHKRWVRFHSLPESKRYPDDEAEYRRASTATPRPSENSPTPPRTPPTNCWSSPVHGQQARPLPGARPQSWISRAAPIIVSVVLIEDDADIDQTWLHLFAETFSGTGGRMAGDRKEP